MFRPLKEAGGSFHCLTAPGDSQGTFFDQLLDQIRRLSLALEGGVWNIPYQGIDSLCADPSGLPAHCLLYTSDAADE